MIDTLRRLAARLGRRPYVGVVCTLCIALAFAGFRNGFLDLLSTPDQRGRWFMEHERYADAARAFLNPIWLGAAQMKAGDFKDAAQTFGGLDTPEAAYDQGNALVMLGKYQDAIVRYTRAIELRPDFADADANRKLATLRAARIAAQDGQPAEAKEPGEPGDMDELPARTGKDQTNAKPDQADDSSVMRDEAIRALWLRRVETRPADFLRSRFAYQLQAAERGSDGSSGGPKP